MALPALAEFIRSPALAVRARRRFGALPLPADTRFTDEVDLPELRRRHPEWRAEPLAPVSVAQDPWSLPGEADASLACVVSFDLLVAGDRLPDAFAGAARVLREEGTLVVSVNAVSDAPERPDGVAGASDTAEGEDRRRAEPAAPSRDRWTFERGAALMERLFPLYDADFEFELATRIGLEHVYLLQRRSARLAEGDLVDHRGHVYWVAAGARLRHVSDLETLALARRRDQRILPLSDRSFSRLRLGDPLTQKTARALRNAAA